MTPEKKNEIIKFAALNRGLIISSTINLERLIDVFISNYFFPNDDEKSFELMELILSTDRIHFDGKRQLTEFLMPKLFPDFKNKHPDFFNDTRSLGLDGNVIVNEAISEPTPTTTLPTPVFMVALPDMACCPSGLNIIINFV